jgi:hypothetical protein
MDDKIIDAISSRLIRDIMHAEDAVDSRDAQDLTQTRLAQAAREIERARDTIGQVRMTHIRTAYVLIGSLVHSELDIM